MVRVRVRVSPNPNPSPSSYPNPNPNSNPSPNPSANPEQESSLQGFQALQDNGSAGGSAIGQTFDKLAHLSRNKQGHDKYYDRNLPKLCSFWTRQTCTRVANTACPYRPCNGTFRFPELASTHPEALSKLVRRLHAEGALSCMRDMGEEMEESYATCFNLNP